MRSLAISTLAVAAMLVGASALHAQVPYVTYYQPTTVYYSAPVATSYTVASPVVVPAPTVTYYRSPALVNYYPTTPVVTRYRPLLGTTVVRYPYRYAPVVYYP
jgi:hypothetical protein